jgi:hypothetical protein
MSPATLDPLPPPARHDVRAPRATRRARPAPPPARATASAERAAAFWRALRATLEGIAHR